MSYTCLTPIGDKTNFPKNGDKVTMHYTGTLSANGKKFDSSVDRGQPFVTKIGVGQVIKGWDEGVVKMSLGEKATLKMTPDFGYGAAGAGGVIPPNADLTFEVELPNIIQAITNVVEHMFCYSLLISRVVGAA